RRLPAAWDRADEGTAGGRSRDGRRLLATEAELLEQIEDPPDVLVPVLRSEPHRVETRERLQVRDRGKRLGLERLGVVHEHGDDGLLRVERNVDLLPYPVVLRVESTD